MIKSLWEWFKSWLALRRLSAAEQAVIRLASRLEKSILALSKRRKKLEALERRLRDITRTTLEDIEQAESIQRQYEQTMELLRSELQVHKEVVIPTLVAGHAKILKRYEAETAVEVMKQVGASIRDE